MIIRHVIFQLFNSNNNGVEDYACTRIGTEQSEGLLRLIRYKI